MDVMTNGFDCRAVVAICLADASLWYAHCIEQPMTNTLPLPDLNLLFAGTIIFLASALVWMFCELQRYADARRARSEAARSPRQKQ
jgi:hypothetical protein